MKWMRGSFLALIAFAMAACVNPVTADRRGNTVRFVRTSDGFKYVARYGIGYPLDDDDSEKKRLQWIADYVREVGLCPKGYYVKGREATRGKGLLGNETGRIWYTGVCKK